MMTHPKSLLLSPICSLSLLLGLAATLAPFRAEAQLTREPVRSDQPVESNFLAPTHIGLPTVYQVAEKNLNSSVKHTFGLVSGGIDHFYGLDDGANTRLGIDYGLNQWLSVGIGRMTFNKVVDLRSQISILQQIREGAPVDLAMHISSGISTLSGTGMSFPDRQSWLATLMIAKTVHRLSVQIAPMAGTIHSRNGEEKPLLLGAGVLGAWQLSDRYTLGIEYLPRFGDRPAGSSNLMAISLNIDTGGHLFQLFLSSSQWHNAPYMMANNSDRFWEGDFRFGFNINRLFGLQQPSTGTSP